MSRQSVQYTEFGHEVRRLAAERGVYSLMDLLEALQNAGYTKGRQTLTNYLSGASWVDPDFMRLVARALDLSQTEKNELAWIYAYGKEDRGADPGGPPSTRPSKAQASSPRRVA